MQIHRGEKLARTEINCKKASERCKSTSETVDQEVVCPRCGCYTMAIGLVQHLQECLEAQNEGKTLQAILREERRKPHGTKGPKENFMQGERKRKRKPDEVEWSDESIQVLAPPELS
jgi:hypothetical protein